MVQLTFDMIEMDSPQWIDNNIEEQIKKGDMVQIVADNMDFEALLYFEYYKPEALKTPGMVVEVLEKTFKLIYKTGEEIEIEKNNVKKEG